MAEPDALLTLVGKLEQADAAYRRMLGMSDGKAVATSTLATAAGLTLSLHGHLFGEAAAALRARAATEKADG